MKRNRLRHTAGVALGVVVVSIVVAKLTWGSSGPTILTPFAFFVLFVASVTLLAVAIVECEEFVDEMEASHPPRVRNRGVWYPAAKRVLRSAAGDAARVSRVWLSLLSAWLSATAAMLRREVTRESVARWAHDLADSLSGIPPSGSSPLAFAGPLSEPVAPVVPEEQPRPARVSAHSHARHQSGPRRRGPLGTLERLHGEIQRRQRAVTASRSPASKRPATQPRKDRPKARAFHR